MKHTLIIILSVLSLPAFCHAQNGEVPDVIKRGFDAYAKSGVQACVAEWLKGSPVENDNSARLQVTGGIAAIESIYGKYIGWEPIRVVTLSDSTRRVYVLAKYEKGPLFLAFDCYKAAQWIIPTLDLNTKANVVLPPILLGGQ